jgi:DmsE family decaheme c-type cytochrome
LLLLGFIQPVSAIEQFTAHTGIAAADNTGLSGSIISHHHGMHDEDYSSLVTYVRQLDAGKPELIGTPASSLHGDVYGGAAFSALREYMQQIGGNEPDSAPAPNVKIAEADNALDALRELLQRGAQPEPIPQKPSPDPNSKNERPASKPAARPTAPKNVTSIFHANFVGGKTCLLCHANQAAGFASTLMGKISRTQTGKFDCENCHGPGSAHIQAVGCASCHGEGGISSRPGIPSLVGQEPEYLIAAMRAYVTGQRKNDVMQLILAGIREGELNAIANYYARQPAARAQTPLIGNPGAGEHGTEICASCHGEHGISVVPAWPSLAGQDSQYLANAIRGYKKGSWTKAIACGACHGEGGISREPGMPSLAGMNPEYLVPAMKAYVNGDRKHRLMKALLVGLSDAELKKIADFYGDQSPTRAQTPPIGDPSAGRSAAALCTGCHGAEGASIDRAWPMLAGQDSQYLAAAINAYKSGSRDKTIACASCHGERGISKRAGMPSLAGLNPKYLVTAMKAYVSGERKHALMKALLADVSEAELNSMAVYYARQAPVRAQTASTGDPAAGKTASADCAGCHGEQDISLAGQDARYLANAIKAYKDGSRSDLDMELAVLSLDERGINDLAAYYASVRPAQPSIPATMQNIPVRDDPVLVKNGLVAGLESRTIADVASYFASLGPERSRHGAQGGKREPIVIRNNLVASLDERSISNVASYYATLRPEQPEKHGPDKGVPARIGTARPADGSSIGGIMSFRLNDPTYTADQYNGVCLGCHEKGNQTLWRGSQHETRGLICTNCHTVMRNVTPKYQLAKLTEGDACFQCHKNKRAEIWRSSHMPIREGKMTCSSCHNPHGSYGEALLKTATINDTCYKCHAEKRGPFLWEHPPARENCLNCHDPHGSMQEAMLIVSRPRLCQRCHTASEHPGNPANPRAIFAIAGACSNCHVKIHGSNSPAGSQFVR